MKTSYASILDALKASVESDTDLPDLVRFAATEITDELDKVLAPYSGTDPAASALIDVPRPEVMDEAIRVYGKEYQVDRFIEESNELVKVLLKHRRTDLPTERHDVVAVCDHIQEEIGDVLITLAQVIKIHGDPAKIRKSMDFKVKRLDDSLKRQENVDKHS